MQRLNYNDSSNTCNYKNNQNQVGFFQLKNDGDTAIVRIMHDSVEDFDLLSVHTLQMGNKYRKVNCLRSSPYDPIDKCPFCEISKPVSGRFFVHLLQYDRDAQGNLVIKPVIWDRAKSQFAPKLKSLIEEYGPLSQRLFKVKRTGVAGATNTTYDLIPCDKEIFNDANYPNKPEAFANYDVLGTMVLDKTAPEMIQYIQTGNFPNRQNNTPATQTAQNTYATAPSVPVTPPVTENAQPSYTPPVPPVNTGAPANVPYNTPTIGGAPTTGGYVPNGTGVAPARPNRYY